MDVFTRRIIGFGVHAGDVDGVAVCRMFNSAVAGQPLPKHISTDHDPLFRFHRWRTNLRVCEIDEIKSVPYVPSSHPFVERLIGTLRREYLDRVFYWNAIDLTRKLTAFRDYYNGHRVHRSLDGTAPDHYAGLSTRTLCYVRKLHLAAPLRWAVSDSAGGVTANSPPTGENLEVHTAFFQFFDMRQRIDGRAEGAVNIKHHKRITGFETAQELFELRTFPFVLQTTPQRSNLQNTDGFQQQR